MDDMLGGGKALVALCDLAKSACGALYKPRGIRKEAEAQAFAYQLMEQTKAISEVEKQSILKGELPPEHGATPLLASAIRRQQLRMIDQQANLENVLIAAEAHLPDDAPSAMPSKEWTDMFFGYAEQVSELNMQDLWGRILAGEVCAPSSFSRRTLEVLRNLTQEEARIFEKACTFAHNNEGIFSISWPPPQWIGALTNADILALRAAGLVHEAEVPVRLDNPSLVRFRGATLQIGDGTPRDHGIVLSLYAFTAAGKELAPLVQSHTSLEWVQFIGYWMKEALRPPLPSSIVGIQNGPNGEHSPVLIHLGDPVPQPQPQ